MKITYYGGEQILENIFWYTSLRYKLEGYADSPYRSADWTVEWFAMPIFAFSFVLMYFGLKKRYTFDLGVVTYALALCWMILPPLISPMSMGGWLGFDRV